MWMPQKPQILVQKVHNNSLHLLGVVVVEVWGWGYGEVNLKVIWDILLWMLQKPQILVQKVRNNYPRWVGRGWRYHPLECKFAPKPFIPGYCPI